ncbi:hypothetical protein LEP1GSC100_4684 [Leptospira interrogans serovar Bataviae str. UI 08561]|nr:hypothetical protein LEP1GSC100_4684 [Leptospira interrogans serovar Bataviae str. UI 08561]
MKVEFFSSLVSLNVIYRNLAVERLFAPINKWMIRIVEKLILYRFSLYGNGGLKRFVNCCYGIFQQLYSLKREILLSFQFVDSATIAFALVILNFSLNKSI